MAGLNVVAIVKMSEERAPTAKPLVLRDTFDGSQCWDDWISHFENVADVNEWNAGLKLGLIGWSSTKSFPASWRRC